MIGTQLGNYRVISRLGEGGMGTVYRATDTMLDRDVALKVLRPELARQAALVERFRAEAVALARLRHEHIAALYGLDRQGEELVMVMEYVSGETLESRLARTGRMSWQESIPILRGVLAALGHAHVRGVVHRDIKPANVMIDGEGVVKVMDFGIARLMGENRQTRAGVAIGTPSYMAPEQLRGEDVDGRTDLYAAGALLFELLTGRVAFQADSDYSLMMQQLNEPPPAPSTISAEIPRAMDGAVARAMAKKPTQRFASATDFSRALDEITPDAFSVEPLKGAAAAVVARAPRDWRVYFIGACVLGAVGLGAAVATRDAETPEKPGVVVDTATVLANDTTTKIAGSGAVSTRPESAGGETTVGGQNGGYREMPPGGSVTPTEVAKPKSPEVTRTPVAAKPSTPQTPANPTRTPEVTPSSPASPTPVVPAATPKAEPTRDADNGSSGARRVESLAERCAASIGSNNASRASSLLRGDTGGLLSAINDGRIAEASAGSVSVDGDQGHFSVRIAWRTAFGGNKSSTARLTADVSRSGCTVESGGGVR
jgi:Protein kinase domain